MSRANKRASNDSGDTVHPPFKLPRLDGFALNQSGFDAPAADNSQNAKTVRAVSGESVQSSKPKGSDIDHESSGISDVLDIGSCLSHPDTPTRLAARFHSIASLLLNDYHLCVSKASSSANANEQVTRFELLEVEVYLRAPGHMDPFAHGTEEQRNAGRWYFHRAPRRSVDASRSATGTGWRGGTRKGLDLTFGGPAMATGEVTAPTSPEEDVRGGMLFRALLPVSGGPAVVGPSLCADAVLAAAGASNIKELVLEYWASDTSALDRNGRKGAVWLEKRPTPEGTNQGGKETTIYVGPRVGLDLSHPGAQGTASDPRVQFVGAPLRFFRQPKLLMVKNRPHTVLGVLRTIRTSRSGPKHEALVPVDSSTRQTVINSLVKLTGMTESALSSALDNYMQGCTKEKITSFVGLKGKGVGGKMDTYMRLMGALDALGLS